MLRLKEFYHQKRDLFKLNKSLRLKLFKRVKKFVFLSYLKKKFSLFQAKDNQGIIHVKSSFNNTIVALTDLKGKAYFVRSTGSCGFQGKKKRSTKFAIETTLDTIASAAREQKFTSVFLCLKGFSKSRHYLLKCLKKKDLKVLGVRDVTPNPHNGCRPKKLRRG